MGSSVQSYDHDLASHLWGVSEYLVQSVVPALKAENEAREATAFLDSLVIPAADELLPGAAPGSQ
jgi:hypothetical protein